MPQSGLRCARTRTIIVLKKYVHGIQASFGLSGSRAAKTYVPFSFPQDYPVYPLITTFYAHSDLHITSVSHCCSQTAVESKRVRVSIIDIGTLAYLKTLLSVSLILPVSISRLGQDTALSSINIRSRAIPFDVGYYAKSDCNIQGCLLIPGYIQHYFKTLS